MIKLTIVVVNAICFSVVNTICLLISCVIFLSVSPVKELLMWHLKRNDLRCDTLWWSKIFNMQINGRVSIW